MRAKNLDITAIQVLGPHDLSPDYDLSAARLIDSDVQLHIGSLFKTIGVSLGYHFRVMIWDVKTSSVFGSLREDLFNYRESFQTFSVGLNW